MPGFALAFGFLGQGRRGGASSLALAWSALDPRLAFARASAGSYVDPATGLIAYAATNEPRFEAAGLLIEEQRTNTCLYSEELGNEWWTKTSSVTADQFIAPDGAETADRVSGSGYVYRAASLAGAGTIRSGYFMAPTPGTTAVLGHNNVARYQKALSVDWQRFAFEYDGVGSGSSNVYPLDMRYSGGGAITVASAWGLQVETGAFPTSYIPTSSSAATRNADVCSTTHPRFIGWLEQTERTLVIEADSPASGERTILFAAKEGDEADNHVRLYTDGTDLKLAIETGGGTVAALTLGTIAAGVPFKAAIALADDAISASLNGAAAVTDGSATLPGALDKIWFGCDSSGNELCGHLRGTWRFLDTLGDVEVLSA